MDWSYENLVQGAAWHDQRDSQSSFGSSQLLLLFSFKQWIYLKYGPLWQKRFNLLNIFINGTRVRATTSTNFSIFR